MAVSNTGPLPMVRESSSRSVNLRDRVVALYEAHREGVYRFLVGHGLSPGEAQEVTQDVFVDLFVALEKGADVKSEQGWLYTVAGRAAVDFWRRERGPVRVHLDFENGPAAKVASTEPSPEVQAGKLEQLRRIAAGLGRLPKEQRLCIQLRMQGLRYREIAKVLGVATSTAADWLVAAVDYLRRESQ